MTDLEQRAARMRLFYDWFAALERDFVYLPSKEQPMDFRISKIERIPRDEYRPEVMLGVVLLAITCALTLGMGVVIGWKLAH